MAVAKTSEQIFILYNIYIRSAAARCECWGCADTDCRLADSLIAIAIIIAIGFGIGNWERSRVAVIRK